MSTPDATLGMPFLCARSDCKSSMQNPRASGEPFKDGPYKGGFLCLECWVLEWDENSWYLADENTRDWVSEEAGRIRDRRLSSEVVFRSGANVAHLTSRGTVRIHLERPPHCSADEYDPDRLRMLQRALAKILENMPEGWTIEPDAQAP